MKVKVLIKNGMIICLKNIMYIFCTYIQSYAVSLYGDYKNILLNNISYQSLLREKYTRTLFRFI